MVTVSHKPKVYTVFSLHVVPSVNHLQALGTPSPRRCWYLLFSWHALQKSVDRNLTWHFPLAPVRCATGERCDNKPPPPRISPFRASQHACTTFYIFIFFFTRKNTSAYPVETSLNALSLLRVLWRSAVPPETLCIIRDRWREALSMFLLI